jgi:hypothetical protein
VTPSARLGRPLPEPLEQAILSCLAKAPKDRPVDAAALAETLTRAGADDWTQADARNWWDTTFTPAAERQRPPAPPSAFLEVTR